MRPLMPERRRWLAAAAGLCLAGRGAARAAPAPLRWPELRLVGGEVVPASHWQGVPVIVVFWATWCGYCKRHNARIDRLHAALAGRAPRILGVAIDGDDAAVARTVGARGWRFPVTVDTDGALRRRFTERRVVPMTCVVDAAATITQCIPGEMSDDDIRQLGRTLAL